MLDRRIRTRAFGDQSELVEWVAATHNSESQNPITPEQLSLALAWMRQRPAVRAHRAAG
jgi:hypothetical protein